MRLSDVSEGDTLYTARGPAFVVSIKRTPIRWRDRDTEDMDTQFEADDRGSAWVAVVGVLGWKWPRGQFAKWLMDVDLLIDGETVRVVGPDTITAPDLHRLRQICAHCGEEWPCTEQRIRDEAQAAINSLATLCAHCAQATGWKATHARHVEMPDGRRFHWLKAKPKCGAAALAALPEGWAVFDLSKSRGGGAMVQRACGHDRVQIGCPTCRRNAMAGFRIVTDARTPTEEPS